MEFQELSQKATEYRIWTTSHPRYGSLEARLLSLHRLTEKISLEKPDGEIVEIDLDYFNDTEKAFLAEFETFAALNLDPEKPIAAFGDECLNLPLIKELNGLSLAPERLLQLEKMQRLESLQLSCRDSYEWIPHLIHLPNLRKMAYSPDNDIDLQKLKEVKQIHELTLWNSGYNLTNEGWAALANMKHLKKLCFYEPFTDFSDNELKYIKDLTNLEHLELEECEQITAQGLVYLKNLVNLKSFRLWPDEMCQIDDSNIKYLEGLIALEELALGNCYRLTDAGLKSLTYLAQLRSLTLSHASEIDDSVLKFLGELEHLEKLEISGCNITGAGLASMKNLSRIKKISID